jgi:hypothetical protein
VTLLDPRDGGRLDPEAGARAWTAKVKRDKFARDVGRLAREVESLAQHGRLALADPMMADETMAGVKDMLVRAFLNAGAVALADIKET